LTIVKPVVQKGEIMRKYVGVKEVAEFIGLPAGTIYYYVSKDKIPYYRFNGKPRFILGEVDRAVRETVRGNDSEKVW